MMKAFKPRYMLTAYLVLCFIFSVAAMNTRGTTSVALAILVFCFESVSPLNRHDLMYVLTCLSQCCFATIFTLALRGLGRHTKRGGSLLVGFLLVSRNLQRQKDTNQRQVAAISGGMVFPPMMGAVVVRPWTILTRINQLTHPPDKPRRPHRNGHTHDGLHPRPYLPGLRQPFQEGRDGYPSGHEYQSMLLLIRRNR